MPTPYAKILVSVNGGANTSGGIDVPSAATIALTPESTVGWAAGGGRWEFYDYPEGWATPAGWTLAADGTIYYLGFTPPSIALPANTSLWGVWMLRLKVNEQIDSDQIIAGLLDETTALSMLSPNGLRDVGAREKTQFTTSTTQLKSWRRTDQRNLRTLDNGFGGGSGTPSGTNGDVQVKNGANFDAGYERHESNLIQQTKPVVGLSTPYSSHGAVGVVIANADYTLLAAEYSRTRLSITSSPVTTAPRTITLPATGGADGAYFKYIQNGCAHALTFTVGAGVTCSVAAGSAAWISVETGGVRLAGGPAAGAVGDIQMSDGAFPAGFAAAGINDNGSRIGFARPRHGNASPYASEGAVNVDIANANFTVTSSQYIYEDLRIVSTPATTTSRTITMPAPGSAAAHYSKYIINGTAHPLVVSIGSGSTLTIPVGYGGVLRFETSGVYWKSPNVVGTAGQVLTSDGAGGYTPAGAASITGALSLGGNQPDGDWLKQASLVVINLGGVADGTLTIGGNGSPTPGDQYTTTRIAGTVVEFPYNATSTQRIASGATGVAESNASSIQTTDATVSNLITKTIPDETGGLATLEVVALRADGSAAGRWVRRAPIKRDGGTLTVGTVEDSYTNEDGALASCDVTIDNSGSSLRGRVTGIAATDIAWFGVLTVLYTHNL